MHTTRKCYEFNKFSSKFVFFWNKKKKMFISNLLFSLFKRASNVFCVFFFFFFNIIHVYRHRLVIPHHLFWPESQSGLNLFFFKFNFFFSKRVFFFGIFTFNINPNVNLETLIWIEFIFLFFFHKNYFYHSELIYVGIKRISHP